MTGMGTICTKATARRMKQRKFVMVARKTTRMRIESHDNGNDVEVGGGRKPGDIAIDDDKVQQRS